MINSNEIYSTDLSELPVVTGDLFFPVESFARSNCGGVVLTPLCDLAHQKTGWIKLAQALPFETFLIEEFLPLEFKNTKEYQDDIIKDPIEFGRRFLEEISYRDNKMLLRITKKLAKIFRNVSPIKPSHYYLPGLDNARNGFLVDFSHIASISYETLAKDKPISRLKSPWREQLVNRYVGFSLRVGTEDYTDGSIVDTIHTFFQDIDVKTIENKLGIK